MDPLVNVVDLRPREAWLARRHAAAVSIPIAELDVRLFELPPKGAAVTVIAEVANDAEIVAAVESLRKAGWQPAVVDAASIPDDACTSAAPRAPRPRLWQPAALVRDAIDAIERGSLRGPGIALDVGCGSGRDGAFLAERGWSVLGIENRAKLAIQAHAVARRYSASSGHDPFLFQIRDDGLPLRPASVDLVLCVRFLHRPLLKQLARYLRPGGVLLYSHFVDGVQLVGTPKNPAGYLMHGELCEVAAAAGLEVTLHREVTLDDGRPIVEFLARRPAVASPAKDATAGSE